ncbi:MAG: hypothetical protein M1839_003073 [Geoglossum umbratile]|nr:MAG: hypothetical protein M1839_003073 [Geoglossum umbratile]
MGLFSDGARVNFSRPESFFHDINNVASVLTHFFLNLPDPVLTGERYADFVKAAKIDHDLLRREKMHALIHDLPKENSSTLSALALHLNRVQEKSAVNRMNIANLSPIFGPVLTGHLSAANVRDMWWHTRIAETIISGALSIFGDQDSRG